MSKKQKVSIVTPSYNQGKFLEKTINSVLSQNYENIEYFVIDGGSSDHSLDIIKKYKNEITGWVSEDDRGQSHAINKGIRRCGGEIFGYINSDDFYEEGVIQRAVDIFSKNPEIDIIYGNFNYVGVKNNLLSNQKTIPFNSKIFRYDFDFICQPASFWRMDVFKKNGLFDVDLKYLMDYDFFLRCVMGKMNFYYDNFTIANLRLHDDCKTISGQKDFAEKYIKIRNDILEPHRHKLTKGRLGKHLLLILKILNRLKYHLIYQITHNDKKESYKSVLKKMK